MNIQTVTAQLQGVYLKKLTTFTSICLVNNTFDLSMCSTQFPLVDLLVYSLKKHFVLILRLITICRFLNNCSYGDLGTEFLKLSVPTLSACLVSLHQSENRSENCIIKYHLLYQVVYHKSLTYSELFFDTFVSTHGHH